LRLYEMGALRIHRRQSTWKGDMTALRAALGIGPDVYKDFAQLRRKVLEVAKAEIDQLAHFRVEWREIRQGRTVAELEFRFIAKDAPAQIATVDELERHSAGRQARRDDTVEMVTIGPVPLESPIERGIVRSVAAALPASLRAAADAHASAKPALGPFPSGSLRFGSEEEFRTIALSYGGGWDVDMIATAYRESMGDRLSKLTGQKLRASWRGFCESWVARRGRP